MFRSRRDQFVQLLRDSSQDLYAPKVEATDRQHKPLYPGRRKSAAAAAADSGTESGADADQSNQGSSSSSSEDEALAQRAERLVAHDSSSSSEDEESLAQRAARLQLGYTPVNYHYRLPRGLDGLRRGPSSSGGRRVKRVRDTT